jgi:HEAT repeat protein
MSDLTDVSALSASEIVEVLGSEAEADNLREKQEKIIRKGKTQQLIAALREASSPRSRRALCYALGRRCSSQAVPILLTCLDDKDANVRTEAAEALGNIGDPEAGPILLDRFISTNLQGIDAENLLAYALGAVGYRPAIPALLNTLRGSNSYVLRDTAALALGELGAREAEDILKEKLKENNSKTSNTLLNRALAAVQLVDRALKSTDVQFSIAILSKELESSDPLLSHSAAWALGVIGGPDAEMQLRRALSHRKTNCGRTKRIREALTNIKTRKGQP